MTTEFLQGAIDPTLMQVGAIVGCAVTSTAFILRQFYKQGSDTRRLIFRIMSRHNREDDDYFALLAGMIQDMRVRNALRDGTQPPPMPIIRRRRYLVADEAEDLRNPDDGMEEAAE